ncbi:MAG: Gfo/Idh/MocA family oxidoreductase [Phycisphaerae bacterium]|nr:Gfo/Idh/MocA family oxidoreductase [Phycisphaerae bacterium]
MAKIDRKSSAPVRLGIVGAGGFARQTLAVLPDCPDIQVVAVADVKRDDAENTAHRFSAKVYVDVRSMMVESGAEAILMSLPHDEYPECVRLAAQRGLHLLKETPLARSIDEALSLVKFYEQADRVFMIGTQFRFAPGFVALKSKLASMPRPFLVRSHAMFNWAGDFGWRGQKGKAGFGAFGDAGYHNIDLLNWLLGPPPEVYAMTSTGSRVKPLHPYDTDDTGLCMLHYDGGLMGSITCSRVTAPAAMDVVVHTPAGTLIATPESFRVIGLDGQAVDEQAVTPQQAEREAMLAKIAAFVAAIRAGKKQYPCSAHDNLINQAVVEAAYLSSRTGQPQVPARIFELHGRPMGDFMTREPSVAGAEKSHRARRAGRR